MGWVCIRDFARGTTVDIHHTETARFASLAAILHMQFTWPVSIHFSSDVASESPVIAIAAFVVKHVLDTKFFDTMFVATAPCSPTTRHCVLQSICQQSIVPCMHTCTHNTQWSLPNVYSDVHVIRPHIHVYTKQALDVLPQALWHPFWSGYWIVYETSHSETSPSHPMDAIF